MRDLPTDDKMYTFANVIFKENDQATYCYIADDEIHAGDLAAVQTQEGKKYTLVAYLTHATAKDAPYPFEKLKHIVGRVAKGTPEYDELYIKFLSPRAYILVDDETYPDIAADDAYFDDDF